MRARKPDVTMIKGKVITMGIKLTSGTRDKFSIVPFITPCGSASGVACHKGVPEEAYARRWTKLHKGYV